MERLRFNTSGRQRSFLLAPEVSSNTPGHSGSEVWKAGISVTLTRYPGAEYKNSSRYGSESPLFHLYSGSVSEFGVFLCFCYLLICPM